MTTTGSTDERRAGQRRRTKETRIRRKALALAAFLILAASALNALFGDRGFLSLGERREQYRSLAEEITQLENENRELAVSIRAFRSDPLVIERRAREVLGMAKEGEIAVSIRHSVSVSVPVPVPAPAPAPLPPP